MNQRGTIADTAERGSHTDAIVALAKRLEAAEKVTATLYERVSRLEMEVLALKDRDPPDDDEDEDDDLELRGVPIDEDDEAD